MAKDNAIMKRSRTTAFTVSVVSGAASVVLFLVAVFQGDDASTHSWGDAGGISLALSFTTAVVGIVLMNVITDREFYRR